MSKTLPPDLEAELDRLALLADADIDTSDIVESLRPSDLKRGLFSSRHIDRRNYDVRSIANWFLDEADKRGLSLSNMSLNKIVYLAVERFLVEKDILLTPARIEAWDHGPVFREVYQSFSASGSKPIAARATRFVSKSRSFEEAREPFSEADVAFLDKLMDRYGGKTASQLRAISHVEGGPWDSVWSYRGKTNPGMQITPSIIYCNAPEWRGENEKED